jgi:hypothetical protein
MKVLLSKAVENEFNGKKEVNYLTIFTYGGNEELGMKGEKVYMWGSKELSGEIEYTIEDFRTKEKDWVNDKGVTITSTYIVGMK